MKFDDIIFDTMMNEGLIPSDGTFLITENVKEKYVELYALNKGNGTLKSSSNQKYALKMAGLSLLKLNESRRLSVVTTTKKLPSTKSGIVYIISNEAWPGYVKVGMTKNLLNRLSSYQTCDPFRKFKVEHYKVVENAREEEKRILDLYKIDISSGEWIKTDDACKIFIPR
jgi:hypothetical protein